jgi:hypothetical protein
MASFEMQTKKVNSGLNWKMTACVLLPQRSKTPLLIGSFDVKIKGKRKNTRLGSHIAKAGDKLLFSETTFKASNEKTKGRPMKSLWQG